MRLALVHNLPSGGAIRSAGGQARGLSRTHLVDLYTLSTAEEKLQEITGVARSTRVYAFTPRLPYRQPLGMLNPLLKALDLLRLSQVYQKMARDLEKEAYDAVLVHPCQFTQAPLLLLHLKCPSLYYCHEPPRSLYETVPVPTTSKSTWQRLRELRHLPLEWLLKAYKKGLDRRCFQRARAVVTNSRFSAGRIAHIYGREAAVLYHGVDTDRFHPGSGPKSDYCLSVGALAPLKGHELVIRALSTLPDERRPRLKIVADRSEGDEGDRLSSLARQLGVELDCMLRVTDEELVKFYQDARLTLFAPVMEPFGLAPLESMACGTPVVGVAEGGLVESITDGVTGYLTPRAPEAFGRAIGRLLEAPALCAQLGDAARNEVLSRWSWNAATLRLEEQLSKLVTAQGPS
jgi:glycosyltransferase involved in cell wall biosynthesis